MGLIDEQSAYANDEEVQAQPANGKKKRGRPRLNPEAAAPEPAMAPKKRGRPKSAPVVVGTDWDLVLTGGKRGRLTLPPGLTKEDVEAVQMQLKPIFELASVQADIEAVG